MATLAPDIAVQLPQEEASPLNFAFFLQLLLVLCSLGAVYTWYQYFRIEPPTPLIHTLTPIPAIVGGHVVLNTPGQVLTATAASYKDELFAYLMFDHLRHNRAFLGTKLMLTYNVSGTETAYKLVSRVDQDLLQGIATIAAMQASGTVRPGEWKLERTAKVSDMQRQTQLFDSAYNLPVRRKLDTLPRDAITSYLHRFIRFKSNTDPRIRLKLEPVPQALSPKDAQQLAGDIITVAEFYSLPLEFFLGIAAMENNYMNVRGDLEHSIWKRRPAADDVILERRRGRVRILNDSAGVWQITRETLRYSHRLFTRDERDYTQLPEHLRPPKELKMNEVSPQVLTTYAGLLLRDLLDRFDGDVMLAVSAYNGGPARPNLRYGEGVYRAAEHARRILERSAALNGESVVRMTWIRRP